MVIHGRCHWLSRLNGPTHAPAEIRRHVGPPLEETLERLLDGDQAKVQAAVALFVATAKPSVFAGRILEFGDRSHDVAGALANGVRPVGVLWGYGTQEELAGAGAVALCEDPSQIAAVLAFP